MKALILVNGELYRPDVLRRRISNEAFDLVLSADAGACHAYTLGVTLDAIVGDMDSLPDSARQEPDSTKLVFFSPEKNETDLELALLYAEKEGADEIILAGAMGGRMDMTMSNILLLAHTELSSCRVEVWHGHQTGWLIRPPGEDITGNPGDTVSLIPLGGNASGVTTEGYGYPLRNEELNFGQTRGISNLMERSTTHVGLSDGLLLAIYTPGNL